MTDERPLPHLGGVGAEDPARPNWLVNGLGRPDRTFTPPCKTSVGGANAKMSSRRGIAADLGCSSCSSVTRKQSVAFPRSFVRPTQQDESRRFPFTIWGELALALCRLPNAVNRLSVLCRKVPQMNTGVDLNCHRSETLISLEIGMVKSHENPGSCG
jgi:hypothetical protein